MTKTNWFKDDKAKEKDRARRLTVKKVEEICRRQEAILLSELVRLQSGREWKVGYEA